MEHLVGQQVEELVEHEPEGREDDAEPEDAVLEDADRGDHDHAEAVGVPLVEVGLARQVVQEEERQQAVDAAGGAK